jgi:general secretion pathway protein A
LYLDYWKLSKRPFENTPDPDFFYFSPDHKEAYIRFKYAITQNKGAFLMTGEYGCGKTTLIRLLVRELDFEKFQVVLMNNPRGSVTELLQKLVMELRNDNTPAPVVNSVDNFEQLIGEHLFNNHSKGKSTLLIVDEAQLIQDDSVLEEIRLLLNFQLDDGFLINLFLVGQPELRNRLDSFPQLEQRLFCKYHLTNLNLDNTTSYINHRMTISGAEMQIFTDDAINEIFNISRGTPRRVNNICDLALLFGAHHSVGQIDSKIIKAAI